MVDSNAKAITIPSGASSNRPSAPRFGTFRFNTDIGRMEYFNGTVFKQVALDGEKTLVINTYTGDASTATFTLTTTPTSVTQVLVFIGGVHQEATTHFTLSSDNITFAEAVPTGETVTVIQGIGQTPT